jgi:hypothetical protein
MRAVPCAACGWFTVARSGVARFTLLLVALLCPRAVFAQASTLLGPDDGAAILFQGRAARAPEPLIWVGPVFRLPVPAASQADLRLEAARFLPSVGRLRGSVDMVTDSAAPGRAVIELGDASLGNWVLTASAGDTPLAAYSFEYRLSSLFAPYAGLRGVQLAATRGATTLTLFAGRTTSSAGWFGERVVTSPQTLAGARLIAHAGSRADIAASVVETSAPSNHLAVPLSSAAFTGDALYRLSNGIDAVGQASVTNARWSSTAPASTHVSWLAGARVASPRRHGDVSVVHLGPEYLPLPYFNVGDRKGWYAAGDQLIGTRLQVYGSANQWQNNVIDVPDRQTVSVEQAFGGGRWQLTPTSFLGMRAGGGRIRSVTADDEPSNSSQRSFYVDYTRQFGAWRVLARGSHVRTLGEPDGTTSWRREADLELRHTWRRGASAWGTTGLLDERNTGASARPARFAGNAGFSLPFSQTLSLGADAELNRQSMALTTSQVRNAALNTSLSWILPRDVHLILNGRYSHDASTLSVFDAVNIRPDTIDQFREFLANRLRNGYEITVRVQKTLKWHSPALEARTRMAGGKGVPRVIDFGTIEGVVFNDLDRNGSYDDGEKGVAHVRVTLDAERSAEVDADGRYVFKNVPAGPHAITIDERSVPAWWDIGARTTTIVEVVKRHTATSSFPLVQLGRLRGRVVVRHWTGSAPVEPQSAPGTNVILMLNDGLRLTMTDADGEFEFSGLPAGEYRVHIDTSSLPTLWTPVMPNLRTIALEPGAAVSGIEFIVDANPRAVRRTLATTQTLPGPAVSATPTPAPAPRTPRHRNRPRRSVPPPSHSTAQPRP